MTFVLAMAACWSSSCRSLNTYSRRQFGQPGHTPSVGSTTAKRQTTVVNDSLASNVSFRLTRTHPADTLRPDNICKPPGWFVIVKICRLGFLAEAPNTDLCHRLIQLHISAIRSNGATAVINGRNNRWLLASDGQTRLIRNPAKLHCALDL